MKGNENFHSALESVKKKQSPNRSFSRGRKQKTKGGFHMVRINMLSSAGMTKGHGVLSVSYTHLGADARNHGDTACYPVDGETADLVILLMAHGGRFPCSAQHQNTVGSLGNMPDVYKRQHHNCARSDMPLMPEHCLRSPTMYRLGTLSDFSATAPVFRGGRSEKETGRSCLLYTSLRWPHQ